MQFMTMDDSFSLIVGELQINKLKWEHLEIRLAIYNGPSLILLSQDIHIIKDGGSQLDGTQRLLLLIDGNFIALLLMCGGSFSSIITLE